MSGARTAQVRDDDSWTVRDDGGLLDLVGFHVRMAYVAMHRDFTAAMRDLDLTQKQFATLQLIAVNPGIAQVAIASYLDADRATIMALVDRLEAKQLVARERSKTDRRRQELVLTGAGKAMLEAARARIVRHEQRVTAMLSEKERAMLISLLGRLHG